MIGGRRPALAIESWLAGLSGDTRDRCLQAYLATVDDTHLDSEKTDILYRVATARPSAPPTAPFIVERRVTGPVELPLFDFDVPDVAGAVVSVALIKARSVVGKGR